MLEDEKTQRLLGEMLSDIRHLQSDVTDIKADQRIRFDKIDARFEKVDARFEKIDARFGQVDDRLGRLERALASAKVWAVLLYVAFAGTMLSVMAHGFKWL
jgi:predicted phage gp36 major capsid-like protein